MECRPNRMMLVGVDPIIPLLMASGFTNATGRSLQGPTMFSIMSKSSDRDQQGLVFGVTQGLGSLARVGGPLLAGWAYAYHATGPFAIALVLLLISGCWTVLVRVTQGDVPGVAAAEAAGAAAH